MKPHELKALAVELTDHMAKRGVRRIALSANGCSLEVELDPAAQVLNADPVEREQPAPKPPGECAATGCEGKSGWLGTPYCRGHFQAELRGNRPS